MVRPLTLRLLLLYMLSLAAAHAQDARIVAAPQQPRACTTLKAELTPHAGTLSDDEERHHRDNARIEEALAACPAGQAVVLTTGDKGKAVFLIGPMRLHEGVTLVVGRGAALWGSRDPRDYDNAPGSCGIVATERGPGCKPLILAEHASHSGLMGPGVVDGRGGATLLGQRETWWQLAHRAKVEDTNQSVSRILVVRSSDDFTLANITLRNSPNCHVSTEHVHGFTAWGVLIDTPKWARNTDGIDPSADTSDITIAHSYIRSGDDNISPKSTLGVGPVTRMTVNDVHFYNGHGFGIGSQTSGGISKVSVSILTIDGSDNGLRIKSDKSRGGLVEDVQFNEVCIRNSPNPIVLNPFYTTFDGTKIPLYRNIYLQRVRITTPGLVRMRGLDHDHRLEAWLEDVQMDGIKPEDLEASFATFHIWSSNLQPQGDDVNVDSRTILGDLVASHGAIQHNMQRSPKTCPTAAFPPFPEDVTPSPAPTSASIIPPADDTFYVAADGTGDYYSIQQAINKVPATGGVLSIAPGTYREQVVITQSHVTLRSSNPDPGKTVIVDDTSQGTRGTKASYATVHVLGDDFRAENLTFENDFNRTHTQASAGSQAQALNLEGDRNVLSNVHILGNQDTLYLGAKGCGQAGGRKGPDGAPCIATPTRSYFTHCVIAGNVDFIYGDANAVFDQCEIRSTAHAAGGYLTAQGKYMPTQQSTFVFNRCTLTAVPGQTNVYLGRPWRPYASVVFLNTEMGAHIVPAGWREWHPGETKYLDTVFYAEYKSTGPGATPAARDPHTRQLTPVEAAKYEPMTFLAGTDHWKPE